MAGQTGRSSDLYRALSSSLNPHQTIDEEFEDTEDTKQFSFTLRKSLRKELATKANECDMTMRSYILLALRDKGLDVTDRDLLDRRK